MSERSKIVSFNRRIGIGLTRDRTGKLKVSHLRSQRVIPKVNAMVSVTSDKDKGMIR